LKQVSNADKLFYFEKSFFTLDGLWMIETENETDWETALKIDLAVWIKMLNIIFHRLMKYLNLEGNTLKNLIEILTFRWSIEGWDYKLLKNEEKEASIRILKCPYKNIMERNQKRQEKIPLICKDMCIPFYKAIIEDFNPEIKVERNNFQGLGNEICDFSLKINGDL